MPAQYFLSLTGKHRSAPANRQLGFSLAFVAGAANAGGYLAVKQYTSHMSGIVSAIADQTALGDIPLAVQELQPTGCVAEGYVHGAIMR